jgi:hypothetical protein
MHAFAAAGLDPGVAQPVEIFGKEGAADLYFGAPFPKAFHHHQQPCSSPSPEDAHSWRTTAPTKVRLLQPGSCPVTSERSNGASKQPEARELAELGRDAVCHGIAVDSNSNIYVGVSESRTSEVANIIVVIEGRVVQLPMTVKNMRGIAVAPDGQTLYVWDSKGTVLHWKQPWSAVDGQVVATLGANKIRRCIADGTG